MVEAREGLIGLSAGRSGGLGVLLDLLEEVHRPERHVPEVLVVARIIAHARAPGAGEDGFVALTAAEGILRVLDEEACRLDPDKVDGDQAAKKDFHIKPPSTVFLGTFP